MKRTQATDCRTLPFGVSRCFAALVDFENYPKWWPARFRVRVLKTTPDHVGSRIEIRPFGGRFVCEVAQAISDREIVIHYVEGGHRGTGRWTLEEVAKGTRLSYEIDLEPHGWLPRLLSNCMNFAGMHSKAMATVFDGLEVWLSREERKA